MSQGGFTPQSIASIFGPLLEQGLDPRRHPAYGQMVRAGMDPDTPVHLLGWCDDPNRDAVAATFAPPLSQAAPHLMGGADSDVFLYRAWKEALGDYPKYVAQQIGDCFPPDTLVTMADGKRRPIVDIKQGDMVRSHVGTPRKVLRTIRKPYTGDLVILAVESMGTKVAATADHQFLRMSRIKPNFMPSWEVADSIAEGDEVFMDGKGMAHTVSSVGRHHVRDFEVCCLEVQEDHSFIANGFSVHNCTSFGSAHAVDLLQCVEVVVGKEAIEYQETCTEAIYGMGREVAGMLGGGDGCYGVAVAKALVTLGSVPRALVGPYDGKRAKRWGASGVPKEVRDAAAPYKVGASALVTTCDELDAALANGYPAAGGFSQGFTMHRDSDGLCRQSGRWGHEEAFVARRRRNGKRQYLLLQSWGDGVPDGPTTDDQPSYSFWVDESAMASILGQRDTTTFSKHPGFKKRPLPASWSYDNYLI